MFKRFMVFLAWAVVAGLMGPLPARAEFKGAEHLAGWWISIDNIGFRPLWDRGLIITMEEMLIVDRQGRFETRMMTFRAPSIEACETRGACSDAPLLATGRIAISGTTLSFSGVTETAIVLEGAELNPVIRSRVVSRTSAWQATGEARTDGGMLSLTMAPGV